MNAPALQVAVMTPCGRGAVAVIRVVGAIGLLDDETPPLFRAANGRPLAAQNVQRIVFGQWGREAVEDVVLCQVDAETLEIHCHGGERAVERILRDCRSLGAEVVEWQTLVAAAADVLEAELQDCLSRAVTWRAAEHLLAQFSGVLLGELQELAGIAWTRAARHHAVQRIENLLRWSEFGIHLSQPWRVVLTGKPNVGKSSLINALLGYRRSIVFDQPGTTRDVVTAETALDGWPVQLIDTAGLREEASALEAEGIARARQQLAQADLVLELIDIHAEQGEWPTEQESRDRSLLIAHKCDLPRRRPRALPATALPVSSVTGAGLDRLQQEIVRRLVPACPALTEPIPVTHRQVARLQEWQRALQTEDEPSYRSVASSLFLGRNS